MEFDELNPLEPIDNEIEAPVVAVAGAGNSKEDADVQHRYKLMLTLWLSLCIVGFVWFMTKMMRGRQRIRYNFHSIEEQLRRMQAVIEERERAQAENSLTDVSEHSNIANEERNNAEPKISPDAQKLLERITRTFENESEDALENVEEREEICEDTTHEQENENVCDSEEINGNIDNETVNNRRRKFIDGIEAKIDKTNVDLIRDTIEDIINEGAKEIDSFSTSTEPSKKDD